MQSIARCHRCDVIWSGRRPRFWFLLVVRRRSNRNNVSIIMTIDAAAAAAAKTLIQKHDQRLEPLHESRLQISHPIVVLVPPGLTARRRR